MEKKIIVHACNVSDHFHDNDTLYSVNGFSSFDFGSIMNYCIGYDDADQYNDLFSILYDGAEYGVLEFIFG